MIALEIISGTLCFFSFVGFLFLTFIIPRHRIVDLRHSLPATLDGHPAFLPKNAYTPLGQGIWFWRNVCLVAFLADIVFIVFWQQMLP